ncbi:hypothetical protein [Streptomyces sp. NPDC050388]|uniref:hypothetical protein n=1 Tax=Streptomyces sp. NPDC050388 TaxID=3155781 RepID=UPI003444A994
MIADAIDTAITLGWTLAAWITVLAAVGTALLLGTVAAAWWTCRTLYRLTRPRTPETS